MNDLVSGAARQSSSNRSIIHRAAFAPFPSAASTGPKPFYLPGPLGVAACSIHAKVPLPPLFSWPLFIGAILVRRSLTGEARVEDSQLAGRGDQNLRRHMLLPELSTSFASPGFSQALQNWVRCQRGSNLLLVDNPLSLETYCILIRFGGNQSVDAILYRTSWGRGMVELTGRASVGSLLQCWRTGESSILPPATPPETRLGILQAKFAGSTGVLCTEILPDRCRPLLPWARSP